VDFFDTCVTRNVHPEYIKYLWASRIREALGLKIPADETYRIRAAIELELCIRNKNSGLDDDFYFPEFSKVFYEHISKNYRELDSLYSEEEFVNLSSKIELDLEFKYQILLTDMISHLRKEKESGKELILVSDFYLSKDEFERMLNHHRIQDLFSEVYVSSEYLKNKRSGRLFDLVISECSLDPKRTTMIGDNIHSDFECPKSKGLNAIHLDKSDKKKVDEELFQKEICPSITSQDIWNQVNEALKTGPIFSNITLTFYSFIARLYRKLREDNVQDVFFLSREGEFLKKLFDHYQSNLNIDNPIKSHYFLASRKSTFLPSLKSIQEETFEILFRQYVNISGKEFILSLNIDESWVESFQTEFQEPLSVRESHFPSSKIFKNIIGHPLFQKEYERKRVEQKSLFLDYVNSFGANLKNGTFSVVDVGWKGTMQDNIRKLLPEDTNVHGYYLGLANNPNVTPTNKKEGIIFSPLPHAPEYGAWIFANTLTVYEILLGASHGSATEYIRNSDNSVDVSLSAHPYETQLYNEKISPLLKSYYEIFQKLCSIFDTTHFNIEYFDRMIAEFHAQMVLLPSEEEMTFIETVSHFENFGVFEFTEFKSNKINLIQKFRNLIKFYRDPHTTLIHSMWPALTLRKLGLGFLQHFYGWYQFKLAFDQEQSQAFKLARKLWRI
jgi:predicted HAD superfamily hydrolase